MFFQESGLSGFKLCRNSIWSRSLMSVSGSAAGTTNPPSSQLLWVWTRMWGDVIQNSRVKSPAHLRFFISGRRHICNYSFARSELATYPANLCCLDVETFLKLVKSASQLCFLWLYVKCCACKAGLDAVKFWKQDSLKHRRHQPGRPLVKNVWPLLPNTKFDHAANEITECYQFWNTSHGIQRSAVQP